MKRRYKYVCTSLMTGLLLMPSGNVFSAPLKNENRMSQITTAFSAMSMAASSGQSELSNMVALYQYAWSLPYPSQPAYDNIVERTELGTIQVVNELPSAVLGYQIRDYDGDDQMELLVVRSDTSQERSKLILQMYEANEQNVTCASEITVDMPAFAIGIGKIRIYSRILDGKILIGCDQYEEGFLSDGLTLRTSFYEYNGNMFNYNSGTNVAGSAIESDYFIRQMSVIGLDENQIRELDSDKTVYDCLPGTELIAETRVDSDFNAYIPWSNTAAVGDRQKVGTAVIITYGWFPGQEIASKQNIESATLKLQTTQNQIQQLADQADYLYIISEFNNLQIDQTYYLIPDENHMTYSCYQTDGTYISGVSYGSAKSIIDTAMTSDYSFLPSGQRVMLVWDSPYGLCAYSRTYKDYNPWYSIDENGNSVEHAVDIAYLLYMLNEDEIRLELESMNLPNEIVIPKSQKTE